MSNGFAGRADLTGADIVSKNLRMYQKRYPRATSAAMFAEMRRIFDASQREVPVKTGNLRNSAYLIPSKNRGRGFAVTHGYNTHYMTFVHDAVGKRFRKGNALFLLNPWKRAKSGMMQRILADAAKFSRGGRVPQPVIVDGKAPPGRD